MASRSSGYGPGARLSRTSPSVTGALLGSQTNGRSNSLTTSPKRSERRECSDAPGPASHGPRPRKHVPQAAPTGSSAPAQQRHQASEDSQTESRSHNDPGPQREVLRGLRRPPGPAHQLAPFGPAQDQVGLRATDTARILQPGQSLNSELATPLGHRLRLDVNMPCGSGIRHAVSARRNDPGPLGRSPVPRPRPTHQLGTLALGQRDHHGRRPRMRHPKRVATYPVICGASH
ncbi:hypothetical protein P3T39_002981 [Kitasatospora sp. GP82]|nr:hypothetical protein [Kitasatospora sp. GP82]